MTAHTDHQHTDHEQPSNQPTSGDADTDADAGDGYACPWDGCDVVRPTKQGMKIHHARSHGERYTETTTCDECGVEYEVASNTKGKYCSTECAGNALNQQVALTCAECGDTFTAPPSEADEREYCSHDCYYDSMREFDRRPCAQCGRVFTPEEEDANCCCRSCADEHQTEKPRPDIEHVEALLWDLYVTRDCGLDETYRRQRAVYGAHDCLSRRETFELLRDMAPDMIETRACAQCGRSYTPGSRQCGDGVTETHCCGDCRDEAERESQRRDWTFEDTPALVRQLYDTEDRSVEETYKRQRAILGADDALTLKQVRALIDGLGIMQEYSTLRQAALDADPDEILSDPDGDDSWEPYYTRGQRADSG